MEESASQPVPQRSRYHLLGLVGQGQFGQVFCAVDRATGGLVALKTLDRHRFPTKKFLRELRFLLSLHHPNIVGCQTLEDFNGRRSLVLDYWDAGTLRTLMESEHRLSLGQILSLTSDILQGLELAHAQGIIHCDIKPENILLRMGAKGWQAGISDFGVARLSQELLKESSNTTGSPAYMAPERFYGQYSFASDLYAVGVLLFEMLVGDRPFSGIPVDLMAAHLNQPILIPETVPFLLRSTLTTALQKLPQHRFSSATAMLKSIQLATEVENCTQPEAGLWFAPGVKEYRNDFKSLRQEPLAAPLTHLAVQGQQVCWCTGNQVVCRRYWDQQGIFEGQLLQHWQIVFPQPLEQLFLTPQGGIALTRSAQLTRGGYAYALYSLPQRLHPSPKDGAGINSNALVLLTLAGSNLWIDLDPQGSWIAYGVSSEPPQAQPIQLTFLRLAQLSVIPSPIKVAGMSGVKILNRRYGVAITTPRPATIPTPGCLIQLFNRRGQALMHYSLPVALKLLTASKTLPTQCFAVEQGNCPQGLLIDFKPWRLLRIPLAFEPDFVLAIKWGYLLASHQGEIVLLNPLCEEIGRFQVPHQVTAIAAFADSGLLIATWQSGAGVLYTVDLRELNLDLLF